MGTLIITIKDEEREVSVTTNNGIDIYDIMDNIKGLLVSWGYGSKTVEDYFKEEDY